MFPNKYPGRMSDAELVDQWRAGRTTAFAKIYDRHSPGLFRFLFRMLGYNQSLAEDFLQEVFLRVIRSAAKIDGQNLSTWMYTIAANLCKNEYRRRDTRQTQARADFEDLRDDSAVAEDAADKLDGKDLTRRIYQLLDQFQPEHRAVFILRFQEEKSIREIAAIMDCPEGTVKSRLHYVLKKISKFFNTENKIKEVKHNV